MVGPAAKPRIGEAFHPTEAPEPETEDTKVTAVGRGAEGMGSVVVVPGAQKYVKYCPLGCFWVVLGHYFTYFGGPGMCCLFVWLFVC